MEQIMILGPQILTYGLKVKGVLIILPSVVLMLMKMRFLVDWKLMLNYVLLSNLPFTRLENKFFVLLRRVQKFGSRQNYYTPMILNVFMVYVKISSMLLLLNVLMV